MDNLKLYIVDMKYVRNLKNVEKQKTGRTNTILSVSSQTHKQGRPFIGIVTMVNKVKYCIPLSSVEEKEKYKTMSENITCRKIRDNNDNIIGILNINNMIPIRDEYISDFIIDELSSDSESQKQYKRKCGQELDWCNCHINEITRLATELHEIICENRPFGKRNICPDYTELEKECAKGKVISKRNQHKIMKRSKK